MINENNFEIVEFLDIEHTDESRIEAKEQAAFLGPWGI